MTRTTPLCERIQKCDSKDPMYAYRAIPIISQSSLQFLKCIFFILTLDDMILQITSHCKNASIQKLPFYTARKKKLRGQRIFNCPHTNVPKFWVDHIWSLGHLEVNIKPCHIPLECRCMNKKTNHIKPT